jgi:hypothetical protein
MSHESRLPSLVVEDQTPVHLASLAYRARGYVEAASSADTRKAYAADWKHFSAWCRRSNLDPLPPHLQTVGLYITACASGSAERAVKANSVSTIERRLSSLTRNYAQRGLTVDRRDRHIATVMESARAMPGHPSRRRRSWLSICT